MGQKTVSTILIFSLLFNSLIPIHISHAEENLPTPFPPANSETTPTPAPVASDPTPVASDATPTNQPSTNPTPTANDTPTPTPTPQETISPTPEITLTPTPSITPDDTPTPTPTLTTEPTTTPEPNPTPTPLNPQTQWTNNNGSYTTETIKLDVTYKFPPNEKVSLTFTKLPAESGTVTVTEHDAPNTINNPGSKDYEITSTMPNGSFEFDLTLPTNDPNKNVLSSQDGQNYSPLDNEKIVSPDTVTIKGVNHLTHFIAGGDLQDTDHPVITELMVDPSKVYDQQGEWIEIKNTSSVEVNLGGWVINDGLNRTISESYTIPVGERALICKNTDSSVNGGVKCNYTASFSLTNSGDTISLKNPSETIVDVVTYLVGDVQAGKSINVPESTNRILSSETTYSYGLGDFGTPANNKITIGNRSFATIQLAIDGASSGDIVNVAAGTYSEDLAIPLSKTNLDLAGAGPSSTTTKGVQHLSSTSFPLAAPNMEILASGVKIHGFTIEGPNPASGFYSSGMVIGGKDVEVYNNAFKIPNSSNTDDVSQAIQTYRDGNNGVGDLSGLNIHDNTFTNLGEGTHGYEGIFINHTPTDPNPTQAITINNNQFSGNILRGITTERSKTTISNNSIITDNLLTNTFQGINIIDYDNREQKDISITGNTIKGSITGTGFSAGIRVGAGLNTQVLTNINITNNTVQNNDKGMVIRSSADQVTINNNEISGNISMALENATGTGTSVNATNNYWGTANPSWTSIVSGLVSYDLWYVNFGKTILSNVVSGSTVSGASSDVQLTSGTSGQADLPSGVTTIALSNTTFMDLSASANANVVSGEGVNRSINISGSPVFLSNFTSGTLAAVNLNVAQAVGGVFVLVNKAVKLTSGTSGQPITLSNTSLSGVNVSIPDSTSILAPSGWNGMMQPPKTGSSIGAAPSGFSIGNTVIEVGSSDSILLFDKPVVVTLSGVTGEVGYKAAGSTTWQKINTICDSYDNPTNVVFPGECRVSNGTDTRIYTYHFTTFGSLSSVAPVAATATSSSGDGGGTGGGAPVCNDTKPGSAPTLISWVANNPNEVTLVWTKAKDPVTYYLITYGTSSGSQQFGNPNIGGSDTTSYTVKGLSGGSTYYFKVRAGNGCMPGEYSNELSATATGNVIIDPLAEGFQPGVLGTTTEQESETIEKESSSTSSAEVLGKEETPTPTKLIENLTKSSKNIFIALIIFAIAIGGFVFWKKRTLKNPPVSKKKK